MVTIMSVPIVDISTFLDGDPEKVAAAFAGAAHVVSLEVGDNRIIVNSMEPRGCYAEKEGEP